MIVEDIFQPWSPLACVCDEVHVRGRIKLIGHLVQLPSPPLPSSSKPEPPGGAHGSKEVKGKTHTYYQVLIDTRDCPHIVSPLRLSALCCTS